MGHLSPSLATSPLIWKRVTCSDARRVASQHERVLLSSLILSYQLLAIQACAVAQNWSQIQKQPAAGYTAPPTPPRKEPEQVQNSGPPPVGLGPSPHFAGQHYLSMVLFSAKNNMLNLSPMNTASRRPRRTSPPRRAIRPFIRLILRIL